MPLNPGALRRVSIQFAAAAILAYAAGPHAAVSLTQGSNNAAVITLAGGSKVTVAKEDGQVGIEDGRVAPDGAAGWLVDYNQPDANYPYAGALVVWKDGHVIRRFSSGPCFWSWSFYAGGAQVSFHTGPLHGETRSHCELREVRSGRQVAQWDGDLDSASRPAWTKDLNH